MTKQRWEIIRAKGLARYFVSFNVLKIGIISGAILASLPYEFGLATHAYSISIWMSALLFVILTLVFTVGFGCLFWHLNEKGFKVPNTDNQLPILNTITKDELRIIDRKMMRRGLYRRLLALPLLIFVFVGLSIVPRSSPHRDFYIWSILIVAWIFRFHS